MERRGGTAVGEAQVGAQPVAADGDAAALSVAAFTMAWLISETPLRTGLCRNP
ncbi:hypothetical protein GCM10009525_47190 [Streptosporangium amethystogenes subsp. fukuiense]